MKVLNCQLERNAIAEGPDAWEKVLRSLRILIVHAGGDSRRLPAYGPCGKIFIPVPSESDTAIPLSLFDRQLPIYLKLPEPAAGGGQVVITSGDVMLRFDPAEVKFAAEGVTGLSCYAPPEQASRHGVFCRGQEDKVRLYLQKPSVAKQQENGAIDTYGQSCLDIGIPIVRKDNITGHLESIGVIHKRTPRSDSNTLCWMLANVFDDDVQSYYKFALFFTRLAFAVTVHKGNNGAFNWHKQLAGLAVDKKRSNHSNQRRNG